MDTEKNNFKMGICIKDSIFKDNLREWENFCLIMVCIIGENFLEDIDMGKACGKVREVVTKIIGMKACL